MSHRQFTSSLLCSAAGGRSKNFFKIILENLLKKVQIITVDKKRRFQTIN